MKRTWPYDVWSAGVAWLELVLATPHVFAALRAHARAPVPPAAPGRAVAGARAAPGWTPILSTCRFGLRHAGLNSYHIPSLWLPPGALFASRLS